MELVLRKYFWGIDLLFIALIALVAARIVNQGVESKLAPAPTARAAKAKPKTAEPLAQLNSEKLAKALGLPVPAPAVNEAANPGGEGPAYDPNAEPVKSGLTLKLLGTLVAGIPEWSIASLQDTSTQQTTTVMTGQKISGAEVLDIQRTRVIILNAGRKEYLDGEAGSGAPPPPPRVAAAPGGNVLGAGIRALDDNNYEVPRKEIDNALTNLNDLAMQARIVPAFRDGVAQGFKVFSIRENSFYGKIGVQNGDVIKRINGLDLNSPEKGLEIYQKLKDASRVDMEIDRNGSTIRKTYNIR